MFSRPIVRVNPPDPDLAALRQAAAEAAAHPLLPAPMRLVLRAVPQVLDRQQAQIDRLAREVERLALLAPRPESDPLPLVPTPKE